VHSLASFLSKRLPEGISGLFQHYRPISEATAGDSGDCFLGRTCRDRHVVRGLFVTRTRRGWRGGFANAPTPSAKNMGGHFPPFSDSQKPRIKTAAREISADRCQHPQ
jgi:hypothetical protein